MSEHEASGLQPAGVFEKVAAKAKKAVGRLIGNDDLTEEGELQQAKIETASEAARLASDAEQRQREADLAAEVESNRIEQQRVHAELSVAEREAQVEREHEAADAAVDDEFSRRTAEVNDQARQDVETIRQEEGAVAATRFDGAVEATAIAQEANRTEATADALHDAQHELERQQTGE